MSTMTIQWQLAKKSLSSGHSLYSEWFFSILRYYFLTGYSTRSPSFLRQKNSSPYFLICVYLFLSELSTRRIVAFNA